MDPVTGATLGLAAFQIVAGAQNAEIIRGNAEITRGVDLLNAQYAELDAYKAEVSGYSKAARYQDVIDNVASRQKSGFAAQGVDVNFGTATEVQAESKLNGFLNTLDIKNQAHQVALGYKSQASNYRTQAALALIQGNVAANAAQTAGITQGLATGVSGYSRLKIPQGSSPSTPAGNSFSASDYYSNDQLVDGSYKF